MRIFFSSLQSLESFTRSLVSLSDNATCVSCYQSQWVSHGYLYKQTSSTRQDIIGKRILCSNRYGKQGCGRTRSLYLAWIIPGYHYSLNVLLAFISSLLKGSTVTHAYQQAVGHDYFEPRQAFRWLSALCRQLSWFRSRLDKAARDDCLRRPLKSDRLSLLLPTLKHFLSATDSPTWVQYNFQRAFI